jgi:hypothetical protein
LKMPKRRRGFHFCHDGVFSAKIEMDAGSGMKRVVDLVAGDTTDPAPLRSPTASVSGLSF